MPDRRGSEELRVLLVGDDPLARGGLAALLAGQRDVAVAGQASTADDLAAALEAAQPDVAAWDLGVGAASSADRLRELPGVLR